MEVYLGSIDRNIGTTIKTNNVISAMNAIGCLLMAEPILPGYLGYINPRAIMLGIEINSAITAKTKSLLELVDAIRNI